MRGVPLAARLAVRITGALQVILGLAIWTGRADALIPIHILDGLLFVITLLAVAGVAARAGVSPALVGIVVAWALVLPVFGLVQTSLLPGPAHVIVQVAHLLLGVGAIAMGDALGRHTEARPAVGAEIRR